MSHRAEHHIEHAEHAAHAAHDSFNTKVTITIAIIAAFLALVTIQGHRAHNFMLQSKIQATMMKGAAANKWAQFQAYNNRYHTYKGLIEHASFVAVASDAADKHAKQVDAWQRKANEYRNEEMPLAKSEAEKFTADAEKLDLESEHWHLKAERLDLGDLGLQLGVVLASLAILTKRRTFWFIGIASAVLGFAIAMTGYFGIMLGEHAHHEHGKADHPPSAEHKSH